MTSNKSKIPVDIIPKAKSIRRKIQVVGGNTITVSLPRAWIKKHRIGKGPDEENELLMRYHPDGSLLIAPANTHQHFSERESYHEIRANPSIPTLKRMLLADFVGGIDAITLRLRQKLNVSKVREIQNFVDKRLLGFDMIVHENVIQVINMTQAPKFDVGRLMEVIRILSTTMVARCYNWISDDTIETSELIEEMLDSEIKLDRQANQMIRTLQLALLDFWMAENVNLPSAEILYWFQATTAAENAADLSVAITGLSPIIDQTKVTQKIRRDLIKLGDQSLHLFSSSLKAFINRDNELAHEILNEQAKSSVMLQKKWPIEFVEGISSNVTLIIRHLEKIATYARKIAEATIDCQAARLAFLSSIE